MREEFTLTDLNLKLVDSASHGQLEDIKKLFLDPENKGLIDIHFSNDEALIHAGLNKHFDIVKYLLTSPDLTEHADIHALNDRLFQIMCTQGSIEMVNYLLTSNDLKEKCDIHGYNDAGFIAACTFGQFECMKLFLFDFNFEVSEQTYKKLKFQYYSNPNTEKTIFDLIEKQKLFEKINNELPEIKYPALKRKI